MNTPLIFERAFRDTLAQYAAEVVPVSWMHMAMQPADGDNEAGNVRFPQMLIQCGGKGVGSEGATWDTWLSVTMASISEDDPRGEQRAQMYEAVEDLLTPFRYADMTDERVEYFVNAVRQSLPTFTLGGFTPEATEGALVVDGLFIAVFTGTLHYDF